MGLGWKNGRECETAHLLERLRAWKKYLYYFFCPPILGVVLSHLLMTDWQNLGKPWELPWMTLRIYSKSKIQKSLLKYVPLTSNCLEISDKNEFTMDEHCRRLKWLRLSECSNYFGVQAIRLGVKLPRMTIYNGCKSNNAHAPCCCLLIFWEKFSLIN